MFRTLLFIPGNNKRFVEKARSLNADVICFDLEDSVPLNEKQTAREFVSEALNKKEDYGKTNVYVRINSYESGIAIQDLDAIVSDEIDGVVVPKVNNETEVSYLARRLIELERQRAMSKKTGIMASIESAQGLVNSYSIATADLRVRMLVFGVFDFLYDMGLDYVQDGIEYSFARAKIPIDAKAAGIGAIDAIWQKVDDIEGLVRDAGTAKRLGYQGKCVIHPKQLEPVASVFVPSNNEVEWARKVVQVLEETMDKGKGIGAVTVDGKMVDAAHYRQAKSVLDSLNNM
ncbi:MAG: CoA ester lyase [Nitrososphaeraceae archaeon]|jgi:citrate lyase subunit beta/citryl-CoA lyase